MPLSPGTRPGPYEIIGAIGAGGMGEPRSRRRQAVIIRFLCIATMVLGAYWFTRDNCGTRGAVACPDPALEEGVGQTISASEVCPESGYLCADGLDFQVKRWALNKGRLRVRVAAPEFLPDDLARHVQAAAIKGIKAWDGHPFPLVIDSGSFTLRFWDIGVTWSEGFSSGAAGLARPNWEIKDKRLLFWVDGIAVAVPRYYVAENQAQMEDIEIVAMHEMGHALGLLHSNSVNDILYPQVPQTMERRRRGPLGLSDRDLQTVEALYGLPNGVKVMQP